MNGLMTKKSKEEEMSVTFYSHKKGAKTQMGDY